MFDARNEAPISAADIAPPMGVQNDAPNVHRRLPWCLLSWHDSILVSKVTSLQVTQGDSLWRIVFTRMSNDERTRKYVARRLADGRSTRESYAS